MPAISIGTRVIYMRAPPLRGAQTYKVKTEGGAAEAELAVGVVKEIER